MNDHLHYLDLLTVGRLIQSRELSSVEVTQHMLKRIGKLDGELHSYFTVIPEPALAAANAADAQIAKGEILGPLHGVPIAVKDLFETNGVTTTHGMPIQESFVPSKDATVITKLRGVGAVILGKLAQTEGAFADHHPDVVPPVNPWSSELWSGASSSGSGVATASGLCFGSLGTDTGGSIRFPSAMNGVTGVKPTWGRVSRYGVHELAASLDHVGPMTRSAGDAAAMLFAIAGADPLDPTASQEPVADYLNLMTRGLKGLRIGLDESWTSARVDEPALKVLEHVQEVVKNLGGKIQAVNFPDAEQALQDWVPLCAVEAAVYHEKNFPARRDEYGPALAGLIDEGRKLTALDYQKLWLARADFRGRVTALFQSVDLLLVPAFAISGPTKELMTKFGTDAELFSGMLRYTAPFDMSGHPTITLPGGRTKEDAPVAFQFVAPHFGESSLFRAGWAFQQATNWHSRHPQL